MSREPDPPSRHALRTCAGKPCVDKRLFTKMFVSRTTRSTALSHFSYSVANIGFYLLNGCPGRMGPNPVNDLKPSLSLRDKTFVNRDRNHGCHRSAGAFHNHFLPAIIDASQEVGELAPGFFGTHPLSHASHLTFTCNEKNVLMGETSHSPLLLSRTYTSDCGLNPYASSPGNNFWPISFYRQKSTP